MRLLIRFSAIVLTLGIGLCAVVSARASDDGTWSDAPQSAPSGTEFVGLYGCSAIYDPSHDQIVMFGGANDNYFYTDNQARTFHLSGGRSWLVPSQTGPRPPDAR